MRVGEHKEALVARVRVLSRAVGVALAAITCAFWFVQVLEGGYYRQLAENNRLRKISIEAPRGTIYDRHDRVLVENLPSYNLLLDRSSTLAVRASLVFAAGVLERPLEDLERILARYAGVAAYQPVLLAEGLALNEVARFKVAALEHPEFEIAISHRRLYRLGSHAAHVLGYLGEVRAEEIAQPLSAYRSGDLVGRRGVERAYDRRLRGEDGERVVVVDSRGQPMREFGREVGRPGAGLHLTLDAGLQQEAERLLEGQVGAVVALDPRNGEIRALVSAPAYDPNLFARRLAVEDWQRLVSDPFHPLQNRALQSTYSPGSVFKIVIATAGLAEGLVDTSWGVFCNGGAEHYGRRFHCWKAGGHGWMQMETALKYSCDVFFYALGQKLGIERIAKYARKFDLGQPTGIDLEGEKTGLVPDPAWSLRVRKHPWYPGETISVAIGQGALLTTPLQVADHGRGGRQRRAPGHPASGGGRAGAGAAPDRSAPRRARPGPPRPLAGGQRPGHGRLGAGAGARDRRQDRHGPGHLAGGLPGHQLAALGAAQPCLVRLLRAGRGARAGDHRLRRAWRPGLAGRRADRQAAL